MPCSFVEKTLPKAQWTLGLSNFFWSYKNLDQISNLDQESTPKSQPNISISNTLKVQNLDQT